MENQAYTKQPENNKYHPETWPRKPNGKIDYDAWIQRIMAIWPEPKPKINRDLTKVF